MKGIVYLVLTIAAGAAIWIGILYWKLNAVAKDLDHERKLRREWQRAAEDLQAKLKAKGMSDGDLLDRVRGIFGSEPGRPD